jgi:alanine dehydrogenase
MDRSRNPFIDELAQSDIILNGIRQDFRQPIMFMSNEEVNRLKRSSLIIDIARDEGLGFPFSKPTSFINPIFTVGEAWYYAVDHTSSYLWNIASWEISISLLPFLASIKSGVPYWEKDETIRRAIQIQNGRIVDPRILSFQNREEEYPHIIRSK